MARQRPYPFFPAALWSRVSTCHNRIYRRANRARSNQGTPYFFFPLVAIALLGPATLQAQENRLENAIFSCIRQAYPDNGQGLDSLMAIYERELIAEGHMDDRSAGAYYNLLQRLASGKQMQRAPEEAFMRRVEALKPIDSTASQRCQEALIAGESEWKGSVKVALFERMLLEQPDDASPQLLASRVLDALVPADFEFPLYRLQTYWILDLTTPDPAFGEAGPTPTGLPDDGPNILDLYLTQESRILIDNLQMDPDWVIQRIERHFRAYGGEAVFVIDTDPDIRFREYMRAKDQILGVINRIRDQYARERYGLTLARLNAEQKAVVDSRYPIQVIFPR